MQTSRPVPVIEVRVATLEDYQGVLDINDNVYQGTDYIPSMYHDLLTDPDFRYYVVLVDGEVGAFHGICHLDDNKTLMLRSLRVKDKFQGQGLANYIRRKMYEDFKDFPGEKRVRRSMCEESRFVRSKTFLSHHTLLYKERRVRFKEIDVKHMNPITTNDVFAKPISMEEFCHMIQTQSLRHYLYPKDFMTQDFWFYDAIPSNIRHIQKRSQRVFITSELYRFLPASDANIIHTNNSHIKKNNIYDNCHNNEIGDYRGGSGDCVCRGILGILSSYLAPKYLYIVINLSGIPSKATGEEEVRSVLKLSLAFAQSLYANYKSENRKLKFSFVCSLEVPEEVFLEVSKPFGLEPADPDENFKEQYYFEQEFEKLPPPGAFCAK